MSSRNKAVWSVVAGGLILVGAARAQDVCQPQPAGEAQVSTYAMSVDEAGNVRQIPMDEVKQLLSQNESQGCVQTAVLEMDDSGKLREVPLAEAAKLPWLSGNFALLDSVEKEKAACLGVSTAPVDETLGKQLGLPRGVGLKIVYVDPEGPSKDALQVHDVLRKLDDQLLVNTEQLAVLVRAKKAGDEVQAAVVREGKPMTVTVKLGEKELPKLQRDSRGFMLGVGTNEAALSGLHKLDDTNLPGMLLRKDLTNLYHTLRFNLKDFTNMPGVRAWSYTLKERKDAPAKQ